MGSFCTSSPAKQTTATQQQQTQTYTPNPQIAAAGTQALNQAQGAATQPFQTPAAPVAPFNPFQQQAFSQIQGIQGGLNPFVNNASAQMTTAGTPINQTDINANMNPFSDEALANMKKYVFDPQRVATMGQATQQAGGVGADRLALTSQNLDKTQADAVGQAQAGFYGQALNAAQQSKVQAQNSAQGWLNLGLGNQTGQLQGTGALATAGAQQQAQAQAQLNSPYQQLLAQIAYPYQQAQFLAGITGGLAGAMGGTTSGTGTGTGTTLSQPGTPSYLNQILGGAGVAAGAYGAFGGFGGGSQGSNGLPTDVANNGSGMYTGNAAYPGFAEGGEVDGEDPSLSPVGDVNPIPHMPLHMTSGQFHNNLNLNPPPAPASSGSGSSSSGSGDAVKMAATLLPLLLKTGGPVNPWNTGSGYAPGGGVEEYSEDQFNPLDAAAPDYSRPIEREAPNLGMWPFNRGQADYKGDVTMFPQTLPPSIPSPIGAANAAPVGPIGDEAKLLAAGLQRRPVAMQQHAERPIQAGVAPGEPVSPAALDAINAPATPRHRPGDPSPYPSSPVEVASRPRGYPSGPSGINSDMKISDFEMPRGQQPYPDSLSRDWGQTAARSPWMALIQGGAKMMQSTKSGLGGLGEGIQAGATHLDTQRKELRSEQQINQKAEELYSHAQTELNRYTRKTPHELAQEHHADALLAQGRFQPINYTDPESGQIRVGNYDAKRGVLIDSMTRQPVAGGVRLLPRGAGIPMTEAQIEQHAKDRFVNEPAKYGSITEAKEAIRKELRAGQSPGMSQPGATAESAIPDPGDGNRVSGTWYINPATGKPDRWR